MFPNPPSPPTELSIEIIDELEKYSADRLRSVAIYAEELAEDREQEVRSNRENSEKIEEQPDELPDSVPSKATITVKEINDNRYYYWQWREGDKIKSEYKGPVDSSE